VKGFVSQFIESLIMSTGTLVLREKKSKVLGLCDEDQRNPSTGTESAFSSSQQEKGTSSYLTGAASFIGMY
jgi:hypothetical protein